MIYLPHFVEYRVPFVINIIHLIQVFASVIKPIVVTLPSNIFPAFVRVFGIVWKILFNAEIFLFILVRLVQTDDATMIVPNVKSMYLNFVITSAFVSILFLLYLYYYCLRVKRRNRY